MLHLCCVVCGGDVLAALVLCAVMRCVSGDVECGYSALRLSLCHSITSFRYYALCDTRQLMQCCDVMC